MSAGLCVWNGRRRTGAPLSPPPPPASLFRRAEDAEEGGFSLEGSTGDDLKGARYNGSPGPLRGEDKRPRGRGGIKPREGRKRTKEEEEVEQRVFRQKSGRRRRGREGDLKGGICWICQGCMSPSKSPPPTWTSSFLFLFFRDRPTKGKCTIK